MGQIDRAGTFIGSVTESTLGQSSGGFPQWVARILADKKYVNDAEEMKHFGITEPGYVDWNFDESILAYVVLFNGTGPLKNYDQLMGAMGWSGDDFQDLTTFAGKRLLFRVEENTFKDKTSLQVNWIDTEDALPERTLKSVDASKIADLNKQFLAGRAKPVAPPKPVSAAASAKPAAAKPGTSAGPKPAPSAASHTATNSVAPVTAPAAASAAPAVAPVTETPKTPPVKEKKTKTPPPAAVTGNPAPGLPESTTKEAAWDFLNEPQVIGQNDPGVITDAWIAACSEVGESVDEKDFTGEMWAKIRNTVLKDLDIKIPA